MKESSVNKGWFCTDLIPLPDSKQFFVSRTQNSVNLIDILNHKIHKLADCPNSVQKFQKMSVLIHKDSELDKVKISIIITKENSVVNFEKSKDPNVEGIAHNKSDAKQQYKFEKMMSITSLTS